MDPDGAGIFPCLKNDMGAPIISMSGALGPDVVSFTGSERALGFASQSCLHDEYPQAYAVEMRDVIVDSSIISVWPDEVQGE